MDMPLSFFIESKFKRMSEGVTITGVFRPLLLEKLNRSWVTYRDTKFASPNPQSLHTGIWLYFCVYFFKCFFDFEEVKFILMVEC